jgi:nucleoside-diphosphate-sugar epimerase
VRVMVIGGTQFIGRRITESLVGRGHDVTVVHRGGTEPADWVDCRHLHVDREDFASVAGRVRKLRPGAVIDTFALTQADANAVLPYLLRLAMIYGEHDPQRREEFILRRVRAGRREIPVGPGTWLWTRCYVGDVATATLAALDTTGAEGRVLNVGEPTTRSMLGWAQQILSAAGHEATLTAVPDAALPPDMWPTKNHSQHLLADSRKAREVLNWAPSDPTVSTAASVRWHLAHPPAAEVEDFTADDIALSAAAP